MYIYDKKDDNIVLYTIEAKKEALREYKRKILEANDKDLLYHLITNSAEAIEKFINSSELSINDLDFFTPASSSNSSISSSFNPISGTSNIANIENKVAHYFNNSASFKAYIYNDYIYTLKKYIEGKFDDYSLKKVTDKKEHYFYLLRTENFDLIDCYQDDSYYIINDIIKLPRDLQILQLLLQGRYSEIGSLLPEQLKLFNIKYCKSIKISDIEDLYAIGLISGKFEDTMRKVSSSSRILQKYKK